MAIKRSRPAVAESECYGPGPRRLERNPFFGGLETHFEGERYTVDSPHGSEFGGGGELEIRDTNTMDEQIERYGGNAGGAGNRKNFHEEIG